MQLAPPPRCPQDLDATSGIVHGSIHFGQLHTKKQAQALLTINQLPAVHARSFLHQSSVLFEVFSRVVREYEQTRDEAVLATLRIHPL